MYIYIYNIQQLEIKRSFAWSIFVGKYTLNDAQMIYFTLNFTLIKHKVRNKKFKKWREKNKRKDTSMPKCTL